MPLPATTMPESTSKSPEPRLTLASRLDDLDLFWPWVEALALAYSIPDDIRFAIDLCLEEALSNVIRHGYRSEPGHPITVDFRAEQGSVQFILEDQAPPFDPKAFSPAPGPSTLDDLEPGGRGILLLRKFASHLAYERLPAGNRLTITFTLHR
jgi:anti-sigma regulatory factor (Ser/Thr protein kinase)